MRVSFARGYFKAGTNFFKNKIFKFYNMSFNDISKGSGHISITQRFFGHCDRFTQ